MVEPRRISFHQQRMAPSSTESEAKPPRYLTRFRGKNVLRPTAGATTCFHGDQNAVAERTEKRGARVCWMGKAQVDSRRKKRYTLEDEHGTYKSPI